jgi:hypothetical protein
MRFFGPLVACLFVTSTLVASRPTIEDFTPQISLAKRQAIVPPIGTGNGQLPAAEIDALAQQLTVLINSVTTQLLLDLQQGLGNLSAQIANIFAGILGPGQPTTNPSFTLTSPVLTPTIPIGTGVPTLPALPPLTTGVVPTGPINLPPVETSVAFPNTTVVPPPLSTPAITTPTLLLSTGVPTLPLSTGVGTVATSPALTGTGPPVPISTATLQPTVLFPNNTTPGGKQEPTFTVPISTGVTPIVSPTVPLGTGVGSPSITVPLSTGVIIPFPSPTSLAGSVTTPSAGIPTILPSTGLYPTATTQPLINISVGLPSAPIGTGLPVTYSISTLTAPVALPTINPPAEIPTVSGLPSGLSTSQTGKINDISYTFLSDGTIIVNGIFLSVLDPASVVLPTGEIAAIELQGLYLANNIVRYPPYVVDVIRGLALGSLATVPDGNINGIHYSFTSSSTVSLNGVTLSLGGVRAATIGGTLAVLQVSGLLLGTIVVPYPADFYSSVANVMSGLAP